MEPIKFDLSEQLITLTLITLSYFYCSYVVKKKSERIIEMKASKMLIKQKIPELSGFGGM